MATISQPTPDPAKKDRSGSTEKGSCSQNEKEEIGGNAKRIDWSEIPQVDEKTEALIASKENIESVKIEVTANRIWVTIEGITIGYYKPNFISLIKESERYKEAVALREKTF